MLTNTNGRKRETGRLKILGSDIQSGKKDW